MNSDRVYDYSINVLLLTHQGLFKPKRERFEFRFCAESHAIAVMLASSNVKRRGYPYDETHVEVTNAIPVYRPILSDECQDNEHDECRALWCGCEHHQFAMPVAVGAPLRSCAEMESEREEELELAR